MQNETDYFISNIELFLCDTEIELSPKMHDLFCILQDLSSDDVATFVDVISKVVVVSKMNLTINW